MVYLWATKGSNLVFKLGLGGKWETQEAEASIHLLDSLKDIRKTCVIGFDIWVWLNDRRGKPQVFVHVFTYQGSILVPVF